MRRPPGSRSRWRAAGSPRSNATSASGCSTAPTRRALLTAVRARTCCPRPSGSSISPTPSNTTRALAKLRPLLLAVPDICTTRALAELDVQARVLDVLLEFRRAPPADRAELVRTHEARAPSSPCRPRTPSGPCRSAWPAGSCHGGVLHLETLRVGRSGRAARRIWLQPEDDVPHVRDRLVRVRDCARPQTRAGRRRRLAHLGRRDRVRIGRPAAVLGRTGRRTGTCVGEESARSSCCAASTSRPVLGEDADTLRTRLRSSIARCLGVPETKEVR